MQSDIILLLNPSTYGDYIEQLVKSNGMKSSRYKLPSELPEQIQPNSIILVDISFAANFADFVEIIKKQYQPKRIILLSNNKSDSFADFINKFKLELITMPTTSDIVLKALRQSKKEKNENVVNNPKQDNQKQPKPTAEKPVTNNNIKHDTVIKNENNVINNEPRKKKNRKNPQQVNTQSTLTKESDLSLDSDEFNLSVDNKESSISQVNEITSEYTPDKNHLPIRVKPVTGVHSSFSTDLMYPPAGISIEEFDLSFRHLYIKYHEIFATYPRIVSEEPGYKMIEILSKSILTGIPFEMMIIDQKKEVKSEEKVKEHKIEDIKTPNELVEDKAPTLVKKTEPIPESKNTNPVISESDMNVLNHLVNLPDESPKTSEEKTISDKEDCQEEKKPEGWRIEGFEEWYKNEIKSEAPDTDTSEEEMNKALTFSFEPEAEPEEFSMVENIGNNTASEVPETNYDNLRENITFTFDENKIKEDKQPTIPEVSKEELSTPEPTPEIFSFDLNGNEPMIQQETPEPVNENPFAKFAKTSTSNMDDARQMQINSNPAPISFDMSPEPMTEILQVNPQEAPQSPPIQETPQEKPKKKFFKFSKKS